MSTFRLDLDFATDEVISPVGRVYVKRSFPKERDSKTYLTQDCASASELDNAIDRLQAELEDLRRRGRAKFNALKGL